MREFRSLLCSVAIVGTALCTGAAQARDSYDCADHAAIPMQERWSPSAPQIGQAIGDFYKTFPSQEHFSIRMCGVRESGKQVMIIGALHIVDSKKVCDDDLNFAVLYEPDTRKFGDVVPHQRFCSKGDVHPAQQ